MNWKSLGFLSWKRFFFQKSFNIDQNGILRKYDSIVEWRQAIFFAFSDVVGHHNCEKSPHNVNEVSEYGRASGKG